MLPLIEFDHVTKIYKKEKAVDDVSFCLMENETLGLVGESGCGKTTIANMILGLLDCTSGEIRYRGAAVHDIDREMRRSFRQQVQLVFQDTRASLNPKRTVRQSIAEPIHNFEKVTVMQERQHVGELMKMVGLSADDMDRYPGEFSGGQRQRIAIARALALKPKLLVLDEATSSLDVSIQAQILNLLQDLKRELGVSYLMISHDLGVVRYMSDRILVMYQGHIVEELLPDQFMQAKDSYTKLLIRSVPDIQNRIS